MLVGLLPLILLGNSMLSCLGQGRQMTVSNMICQDEDGTPNTRFVDRHNGWGLTALHIAVFQGSVHTGGGGIWSLPSKCTGIGRYGHDGRSILSFSCALQ
jgi:hypothetical protein